MLCYSNKIYYHSCKRSLNELAASHISHNFFTQFNLSHCGEGEGKGSPAFGIGIYVSIDWHGNKRYLKQAINAKHFKNGKAYAYYYEVTIPDINNNYLFDNVAIKNLPIILNKIKKGLSRLGIKLEDMDLYNPNMSCKRLFQLLRTYLENEKYSYFCTSEGDLQSAASGFLDSCGIVGMICYQGDIQKRNGDQTTAIIFNPSNVVINRLYDLRDEFNKIGKTIQPKNDEDRDNVKEILKNCSFFKDIMEKKELFDYFKYFKKGELADENADKILATAICLYRENKKLKQPKYGINFIEKAKQRIAAKTAKPKQPRGRKKKTPTQ